MLSAFVLGLLLFLPPTTEPTQTPPAAGASGAFLDGEGRSPIAGALVALYEQGTGYLVDSTYTDNDTPTQTPPAAGVSGAFLDGEGRSPIAGALVALYEQGTGYLVDSTYTDNDGRFSLRPPTMGAYFLVLTKGGLSERVDLTYDGKNVYREVLHRSTEPSLWTRLWRFLVSLQGVFGIVLGALLGYYLKQWGDRKAAEKAAEKTLNLEISTLRDLVTSIKVRVPDVPITPTDYEMIIAAARPKVEAIKAEVANASISEAAFALRGDNGVREVSDYRETVEEIERIAGETYVGVGAGELRNRLVQISELRNKLDSHSLVRERH